MKSGYPFQDIEKKWQDSWAKDETYKARDGKPADKADKFYGLIEFPYPSGEGLHVGHPRSYTAIDIMTRKKRMEGKNVLYPIGWDAFGLPTENFAIKNKIKPADATKKNVANFTRQLKSIGFGFDWSREVDTTDPTYYKWTQWMFLKFFNSFFDDIEGRAMPIDELAIPTAVSAHGPEAVRAWVDSHRMAYKAETVINWCPRCKIGLANEEAQGGTCERCGNEVEQRTKAQWMIRITKYADRLIKDLDTVDYLDQIKAQQVNWIGKSEGAYVDFQIHGPKGLLPDAVTVFTTRLDTLFGATYLVLAPEHPLVQTWMKEGDVSNAKDIVAYQDGTRLKSELQRQENKEKTGVELSSISAKNPATGEFIPVWIADYVLGGYGTGAIMAVPAHDDRDCEFAKVFGLPVKQVVEPSPEAFRGTGVFLEGEKGKFIFQVRDDHAPSNPGMISLFGGGKQPTDADGMTCLIRELKEELELSLKETDLTYVATVESHTAPGKLLCVYKASGIDPKKLVVHEGKGFLELTVEEALAHEKVTPWTKEGLKILSGMKVSTYAQEGVAANSGILNGLATADAKRKMVEWLEANKAGERKTTYRLRDWVFSRQRYWGEPIPIVICKDCGYVPVPDAQLPLVLPEVEKYEPTDSGESPLADIEEWVVTTCPNCGKPATRETDTMPNWAGSSWYFLRYCDPHNDKEFASQEKMRFWMPVDLYNGGMEHTTLHLLYSRFWYKFLWDLDLIPRDCGSEPYKIRRSHGLILGEGGIKMSKSKGNVVNPDDVVEAYGADVFRMYEMFMGPFDQAVPWDTNGIEGVKRFLEKVWRMYGSIGSGNALPEQTEALLHRTIKKVGDDIESMNFNTAVSAMMILVNELSAEALDRTAAESILKILAPFAPHMTEELWHTLGNTTSIHVSGWPAYDSSKLKASTFELVIQVNGKVRDKMTVASDISEKDATTQALASEKIQAALAGKTPQKIVYVNGRLLSISV